MRVSQLLYANVYVLLHFTNVVRASAGVPAGQYGLNFNYLFSANDLLPRDLVKFDERPEDCPPCFNCNLEQFQCHQFGNCSQASGTCTCPSGYGGDSCLEPLCGSPAQKDRPPRGDAASCTCDDGWEGIHCNLCKTDSACDALMPEKKDGVCYTGGLVQKENHQNCDITNKKIVDALKPSKPQATFSCNAGSKSCSFQMWIGEVESFYCGLDDCTFKQEYEENRNTTTYECKTIQCRCIQGRNLCGGGPGLDIGDFLKQEIKGPGNLRTVSTVGGSPQDGSYFSEPQMDGLVQQIFGDESITLSCKSSECLYRTEMPGYTKPVKKINTPMIGGLISGCALFLVAGILLVVYLRRRSGQRKRGHILLSQEEDEADAKLMADHKPAALHFENVCYSIGSKQILSGIQGAIRPGEITAIMGPSGAGKTSFLDILARKNKKGLIKGQFYINGESIPDDLFRNVIGFVDQEDNMLPTLTVHETILDSAMLRLPKDMSFAAKNQKVEDVEKQLGIWHIRDSYIGSEESGHRGISGGEKRRVSIACELVTSPSLLFLDEPTSGLDSFNAFNVIESLVTLVKTYNRTVVFTIHQPRSNIVSLFDNLILLARGRTVYSGPFAQCQSYFDSVGFLCPPGYNIADYLIDLMMHAGMPKIPMDEVIEASAGADTRTSSIRAIKSINSKADMEEADRMSLDLGDLVGGRRSSIRQSQERQLFTRRLPRVDKPRSAHSSDFNTIPVHAQEASPAWMRLLKESGSPPPQQSEDPFGLPPDAKGTGTDLDTLINSYAGSDVAVSIQEEIRKVISNADGLRAEADGFSEGKHVTSVRGYEKTGIVGQFTVLSVRTWRNLYRNPMLMLTHYAISIVLAVFLGFLFFGVTDDIPGFQNRLGLLFFVLALFGFSTLTSLTTFAQERVLFVRERAKGYYMPVSYFAAKVIFDMIPLRLIPPIILSIIVYPMAGLVPAMANFWKFVAFLCMFNFAASAVCLFIGIVFRNGGVANLIGSLFMLFSLLFSGFLLNHGTIPKFVLWLQMLSIYHFGFEGLIVNEVRYLTLIQEEFGLNIEVPGSVILSSFGFNVTALGQDLTGLFVFTGAFILLGYAAMHFLLVEQR